MKYNPDNYTEKQYRTCTYISSRKITRYLYISSSFYFFTFLQDFCFHFVFKSTHINLNKNFTKGFVQQSFIINIMSYMHFYRLRVAFSRLRSFSIMHSMPSISNSYRRWRRNSKCVYKPQYGNHLDLCLIACYSLSIYDMTNKVPYNLI